jgi:urease accessory protein
MPTDPVRFDSRAAASASAESPVTMPLALLQLCDSLFPVGAFAHSDGLETATATGRVDDANGLQAWVDACLADTIARLEGPVAWTAWALVSNQDWPALADLDATLIALRPSSAARRSTRAMGQRLLTTWHSLYPDPRLDAIAAAAQSGSIAPSLPVAFAAACVTAGVSRRQTVEALAYTRLAATVSAAMRLAPIGQAAAHAVLARSLERVPAIVDAIARAAGAPQSFAPLLDIAAMSQQYLHSRLFRS